ncbi:efflux RND transporter periplasmic adaptor subunit [Bacillus sp. JCM 19034]|uniref:efflux RND transporter periplasmic adaptor subunit n=1 Tax=Bacillus sp. JCM 19034 TaxID=1481928 RepID=UPI000780DEF5|nr:efflux RND transporter periplasmic adaptor subunit [Bacillus sp. JCM 19034]
MTLKSIATCTVSLFVLFLVACGGETDTEAEPEEIVVAVEEVKKGDIIGENRFIGQVQAGGQQVIMPKVPGEIVEVLVEKGDYVEKGDILARLDNQDLQLQLEADEAQLEQARNGLRRAENGKKQAQSNVTQAESQLSHAKKGLSDAKEAKEEYEEELEAQIEEAEKMVERLRESLEEGGASEEQVEQAEEFLQGLLSSQTGGNAQMSSQQSISSIEATVEQAETGVDVARSTVTEADLAVEEAKRMVNQAKKAVERSEERLDDAVIRATAEGEVLAIEASEGDIVSPQAPFAHLISLDSVIVTLNVTAEQLSYFSVEQEVEIEVSGVSELQTGEVTFISPSVNDSRLFPIEIEIENTDAEIRQGMVASVFIEEVLVEDEQIVPTEAILESQGRAYVFVVEDGAVREVEVEVVRFDSEQSAIRGEIEVGDQVVIKGQHLIDDGDSVRIVEEV